MPAESNRDLRRIYDEIYKHGKEAFFSKYVEDRDVTQTETQVLSTTDFRGKKVVDLGCGAGRLISRIAASGATEAIGIDYSAEAIAEARRKHRAENLKFVVGDITEWDEPVDIAVSCGTLEHLDAPWGVLQRLSEILPEYGEVVVTVPCFLNVRGIVWMALARLLNVPMSLTDLHFISPWDIQKWLADTNLDLVSFRSFDYSRANGDLLIADFEKRLPNALRDAGLSTSGVEHFLVWLRELIDSGLLRDQPLFGALALYHIRKVSGNCIRRLDS